MKHLRFRNDIDIFCNDDVDALVAIIAEYGYTISREDAHLAWEAHSDTVCASWLSLPLIEDGDDPSGMAAFEHGGRKIDRMQVWSAIQPFLVSEED